MQKFIAKNFDLLNILILLFPDEFLQIFYYSESHVYKYKLYTCIGYEQVYKKKREFNRVDKN